MKHTKKEIQWGGRPLVIETGHIARQAAGAALVTYGETSVLATVTYKKDIAPEQDFFPLGVHYLERSYASGRIPGGYFKREGRPTEREILTSRMIDRSLRPLFHGDFLSDTQVVATVLAHDGDNDSDIPAIIASSAAVAISGLPFMGPCAGVRIGLIDGDYVLNPTGKQLEDSCIDVVISGTKDGIVMVESEAKEVEEKVILDGLSLAHRELVSVLDMIEEIKTDAGLTADYSPLDGTKEAQETVLKSLDDLTKAYAISEKLQRKESVEGIKKHLREICVVQGDSHPMAFQKAFKNVEKDIVRTKMSKEKKRLDGRDMESVRPISCISGLFPRVHGSGLFTRGDTQALAVATLGTDEDEQRVDAITGDYRERFMLNYNFPSYCVGEVGRIGAVSRRETGHGKLAWRALRNVLPDNDTFPYVLRIVSEIMESDGSSSMATVCAGSMALMNAGVPVKNMVAGVAMGLVKGEKESLILTDIIADEDHLGDMDFKVAGTRDGITALQMDIKIPSITREELEKSLEQARKGRMHILDKMEEEGVKKEEVSAQAPSIETMTIPREKIRDVIGSGGKIIREIVEKSGARVNVSDDGVIKISAQDQNAIQSALEMIRNIVVEPEEGKIYDAKVERIMDYGAFVLFLGKQKGLVHISEMSESRVESVSDVVSEGQNIKIKFLGYDNSKRPRLSMKGLSQES